MNYNMTEPCDACPFLKTSGFTYASLVRHSSGEFGCHKACDLVESEDGGDHYEPHKKTPHCAGALIFLEKQNRPHQLMRIMERIGGYDMRKLNMAANVGSKPSDYRKDRK